MALSNMINKVRTDAGLSTEQFAEIFGVSRQSVQKWESGESVPALDKLTKIAKAVGRDKAYVFNVRNRAIKKMADYIGRK